MKIQKKILLLSIFKRKQKKDEPLFTIRPVDAYGTADQSLIMDDDRPIGLFDQQTLAINWTEEMADQFFDESICRDMEVHESSNQPPEKEMEDSITLDKCIDLFTTTEKLGPEDPWYCAKCKQFQQATKKFDVWSLPPILVIHLKRFSYKNRYWREKLETIVNYPITNLNMSHYVKGPDAASCIYDLYAVSNHYGSLGGGHYTAYGKNRLTGDWYKFDDSSVSKVDESRVVTSSAYVLFYRKRDPNAPTSSIPNSIPTRIPNSTSEQSSKDEEIERGDGVIEMDVGSTSNGGEPMDEVKL